MDGMRGGKGAVRKIDLDAFFQSAEDVAPSLLPGFGLIGPQHFSEIPFAQPRAPFHTLSSHFLGPCVGVLWVHRREPQWILTPAGELAKNRAPFHLVSLSSHFLGPFVRVFWVHRWEPQRILTLAGKLAKNRAPFHLAR